MHGVLAPEGTAGRAETEAGAGRAEGAAGGREDRERVDPMSMGDKD